MAREIIPCVYILARAYHRTLYTGATSNLTGRVIQHRDGIFDGFTKRYGIKRLVFYEEGATMEEVIRRKNRSNAGRASTSVI